MRKIFIPATFIIAGALAFTVTFLQTLKLTKLDAENAIWSSFSYAAYAGPTSKTWHSFSAPVRVAMVKEIGAFAKAYSRSEDFKNRYAGYREEQKPPPPAPLVPVEELKNRQRADLQKSLKESEEAMKTATGETKKVYETFIQDIKQQLKMVDDPNNEMYSKEMDDMMLKSKAEEMREHQTNVATWEKEYPVSPAEMIKSRLTYFLQLSATVDFNAKLGPGEGGLKIFLSKAYEDKPSDWKLIFRAGKESTDAARAVATQWLGEIK